MEFEPTKLEEDLKRVLRRELPSVDFVAKVLAKAAAVEKDTAARQRRLVVFPVWRKPAAWAIAAGITLAAIIPAGVAEYRQRQERRAMEAGRQLALALTITRVQLQKTKERLQKASKQHAL